MKTGFTWATIGLLLGMLPGTIVAQTISIADGSTSACSGLFTDTGGTDAPYGPNEQFTFTLCPDTNSDYPAQLLFSALDLGAGDQLCFYDGEDDTAPLLLCSADLAPGQSHFAVRASTNNTSGCLTVVFTSDANDEGDGWVGVMNCASECQDEGGQIDFNAGTVTWCATGGENTRTQRVFTRMTASDLGTPFCFYDGPDENAPLLNCLDSLVPNDVFIVQATPANSSGCLTMTFGDTGWSSFTNCVETGCQDIIAVVDSTRPAAQPTPGGSIDICPGERVFFFGSGEYPQSGQGYEHSDANSEFRWEFGDGTFAFGRTVSHRYDEPGGYTVQLTITDPFGCTSQNAISQHVRVAPRPSFQLAADAAQPVCAGDDITLNASIDDAISDLDLLVQPGTATFDQPPRIIERVALPDGIGVGYETTLTVRDFAAGQTLQNPTDLEAICVNLEHSWLEDLDILLTAPNGQTIHLQRGTGSRTGQTALGAPVYDDEIMRQPGEGFRYCWSDDATNPSWLTYVQQTPADTLPAGTYRPSDSFSGLIGTPLNGEWTLTILDDIPDENGFLFSWTLLFAPALYTNVETFSPALLSGNWIDNSNISSANETTVVGTPRLAGLASFGYMVTDSFGCTFDTTLQVPVRPFFDPACIDCAAHYPDIPDQNICDDETITLDASGTVPVDTAVRFQNTPQYPVGFANHPPDTPYENTINVSGVLQDTLVNPEEQIASVCVNLETDWAEDIALFLRSPDGRILELSTNNGGQGDDYRNTCFTPNASLPITDGTAPFAGTFLPEGDWNTLQGAPINGAWTLLVSDEFDEEVFGALLSWSIQFHSVKEVTYAWSGDAGLSCTDCPTPEVSTTQNATFVVSISDDYGCNRTDTVQLTVVPVLPAPEVSCQQVGSDAFQFTWNRPAGVSAFELTLRINGVPRAISSPVADTSVEVSGLVTDDEVTLEVLPITLNPEDFCRVDPGSSTCIFGNCLLEVELADLAQPTCFDSNDGVAEVNIVNGSPPYRYFLNNSSTPQESPRFDSLSPGPYFIVVRDATFCLDTVFFDINAPDSLAANMYAERAISCFGNDDGRINTLVTGGTGPYTYTWDNGQAAPLRDGLEAGTYRLTVTDANACTVIDAFNLQQPDSLSIQIQATDVQCFGDSTGRIAPIVTGGSGTYQFNWNNASTDSLQTGLEAGQYCVTVSDRNACVTNTCIDLTQPTAISVDSFRVTPVDCYGQFTGQASVFVSGGNGPYEYLWEDALAQIGITASNLPAGEVGITVIDFNRCELDTSIFIPQPDSLQLSITSEDARCREGNEGQASVVVAGGTAPYNYLWQDGRTTPTADSLSRGNYRVTVTDDNGCRALASTFISEPELLLTLDVTQTRQGCFGAQTNEALVTAQGGSGGDYRYQWSNGQNTPTATALDSLRYTVSVTDGNGCQKTTGIKLTDLPQMVPNMIINAPSCFGFGDGAIGINFVEGRPNSELNSFRFVWNTGQVGPNIDNIVGDSTYTVTVTDPRGCAATASRYVREPQQITFDIETTPASCFGGNNGTALVTNITSDSQDLTYRWDAGTGNQEGISATGLAAGSYRVTVSDPSSCFGTGVATIDEPEQINVSFSTTDNVCFGDQQGTASAEISGGTPEYNLQWPDGRSSTSIDQLAAGTYALTVTDAAGCRRTEEVTINHPPPITLDLRPQDVTCFGDTDGGIIAEASGGAPPYTYSLDNGEYNGSPLLIGLEAGTYDVYVRDAGGCTLFERTEVRQPEQMVVDAGPSLRRIERGDTLQLQADIFNPQGPVMYQWFASFGDNLSCTDCPAPLAYPDNSISYEVLAIDSVGCEADDRIQVIVEKKRFVVVPTGFSPNGDGQNDQLLVHGRDGTVIDKFQVFDRWGELVYQREDFPVNDPAGWNGMFRNQDAPVGLYIWYLEITYPDDTQGVLRGQTTLIR